MLQDRRTYSSSHWEGCWQTALNCQPSLGTAQKNCRREWPNSKVTYPSNVRLAFDIQSMLGYKGSASLFQLGTIHGSYYRVTVPCMVYSSLVTALLSNFSLPPIFFPFLPLTDVDPKCTLQYTLAWLEIRLFENSIYKNYVENNY